MKPNFLQALGEDLHLFIFSYLNGNDLINLCYVSKYYRRCVLKKIDEYYNISTGLCLTELWTNKVEENLWGLIDNIFNDLIVEFDPEDIIRFRLKNFAICLYFQYVCIF